MVGGVGTIVDVSEAVIVASLVVALGANVEEGAGEDVGVAGKVPAMDAHPVR